jgi:HD superfamily phosphohydrolase
MDYLVRDSHYTGVAFGLIDHVRLLHELRFYEGKLVVEAGGLQAAESLLVSRFLMYPTVYYHHVGRIAEAMATHAAEKVIEAGMSPQRLRGMDDSEFMDALRRAGGYPGEIADRLRNRRLFKRALYTGLDSINRHQVFRYRKNIGRVEREIAEEAGVEPGYVLVDIPPRPEITEIKAKIMINNKLVSLDEASHLVAILGKAQEDSWRMGVYVPGEYREAVGRVAREFFDVKRETKQFRLSEL